MALIIPKSVVGGTPQSVTDLLKSDHIIPAYQRDYVWQEKQVEQLWDDLIEHYARYAVKEELPNPEGYFLGAMVVIEHAEDGPLEIVDGQQRLATLSTIVSVLFDALQELPSTDHQRIGYEQRLREMLGKFDVTWKPNLSFTDSDLQAFFLGSVLLNRDKVEKIAYWSELWSLEKLSKKRSPIARFKRALEVGYEKLEVFLDKQPSPMLRLMRLVSFVRLATEGVVVLKITAKSYNNAYSVFESLNNRSVPLSQADLIKNELLKVAPSGDRNEIVENWATARQVVDGFESIQLPDLLHYSYLSRHGKARAKELYAKTRDIFAGGGGSAKNYSSELVADAEALNAVCENFQANWTTDTTNMLKDVRNVLGVKLCHPFLIAAYRKYESLPGDFEAHVRTVMNFAFRYMKVLEGSIETLANAIGDACQKVAAGKPLTEVQDLFREHAPDSQFEEEFETVSLQSAKLGYFAVYYLEKIRLTGTLPIQHGVDQNLEHIMPRNPTVANWPLAHAAKLANPENYKVSLWRVGNLLPLPASVNKSIKNREISHKISNASVNHYSSPSLGLVSPKEVVNFLEKREWTPKSIDDRQKYFANHWAVKAWSL